MEEVNLDEMLALEAKCYVAMSEVNYDLLMWRKMLDRRTSMQKFMNTWRGVAKAFDNTKFIFGAAAEKIVTFNQEYRDANARLSQEDEPRRYGSGR